MALSAPRFAGGQKVAERVGFEPGAEPAAPDKPKRRRRSLWRQTRGPNYAPHPCNERRAPWVRSPPSPPPPQPPQIDRADRPALAALPALEVIWRRGWDSNPGASNLAPDKPKPEEPPRGSSGLNRASNYAPSPCNRDRAPWVRSPPSPPPPQPPQTERAARSATAALTALENNTGGEGGIRTHGTLPHTRLPNALLRPLGHPSRWWSQRARGGSGAVRRTGPKAGFYRAAQGRGVDRPRR